MNWFWIVIESSWEFGRTRCGLINCEGIEESWSGKLEMVKEACPKARIEIGNAISNIIQVKLEKIWEWRGCFGV